MYVKMQFFLLSSVYDVNEGISSSTRCSKLLFEKGRESEESSPEGKGMGGVKLLVSENG